MSPKTVVGDAPVCVLVGVPRESNGLLRKAFFNIGVEQIRPIPALVLGYRGVTGALVDRAEDRAGFGLVFLGRGNLMAKADHSDRVPDAQRHFHDFLAFGASRQRTRSELTIDNCAAKATQFMPPAAIWFS